MATADLNRDSVRLFLQDGAGAKVPAPVLSELWEELLIERETCWGRVVSDSMYPMIKRGDQVLVQRALLDKVRFGDIVVFRKNGELTTHRVLGKREISGECHFLEKGDASLQSSLVPAKNIIGRVSIIRNSGKTVQTISGSGHILQLILALASYASLWMWAALEYCLTHGGRTTYNHRYAAAYNRFFSLLRRIMVRPLL